MNGKVGIVGAGLIGRSWAIVFARSGFQVSVYDAIPDALTNCKKLLKENLEDLFKHGLIKDQPEVVFERVQFVSTLKEAVVGALLVQENVKETLEVKISIFQEMDELAEKNTILASSTSMIRASAFSENLVGRERILVAHPVNPPYLIPLVELSPSPWTSKSVLNRSLEIFKQAGQSPVVLKKEIEGFLLNRIQIAVLNEALNLYEGGYASAADIDTVMKDGLGMRWAFMGPFETIDLNAPAGVSDYASRFSASFKAVAAEQKTNIWAPKVIEAIHKERREQLGLDQIVERSRWRDNRLMALAAHKQKQSK